MANKSKLKKVIISIISVILSLGLLIALSGIAVYNFVIIPKYNEYITKGEKTGEKLSNKDIVLFAKYLTDKQFITNLVNIDKETAKDVLSALLELEDELGELSEAPLSEPSSPIQPGKVPNDLLEEVGISDEQKSAYERIMAAASKEEIALGLSIISKVDVKKVMELNEQGKKAELKAYLKSVLTPKEISDSMKLYRKYKHLL